jgi:hypothetical protein
MEAKTLVVNKAPESKEVVSENGTWIWKPYDVPKVLQAVALEGEERAREPASEPCIIEEPLPECAEPDCDPFLGEDAPHPVEVPIPAPRTPSKAQPVATPVDSGRLIFAIVDESALESLLTLYDHTGMESYNLLACNGTLPPALQHHSRYMRSVLVQFGTTQQASHALSRFGEMWGRAPLYVNRSRHSELNNKGRNQLPDRQAPSRDNTNFKTKPCKHWKKHGTCPWGAACAFKHPGDRVYSTH